MKVRLFVNAYGELTTDGYNPAYDKYDYEEDVAKQIAEFEAFCEYMGTAAVDNDDFEPLDEEDPEPIDFSRHAEPESDYSWDDYDDGDFLHPYYGPLFDI